MRKLYRQRQYFNKWKVSESIHIWFFYDGFELSKVTNRTLWKHEYKHRVTYDRKRRLYAWDTRWKYVFREHVMNPDYLEKILKRNMEK